MDIQGYIPPSEEHPVHHYAENQSSLQPSNKIPTILPTLVEEDSKYSPEEEEIDEPEEEDEEDELIEENKIEPSASSGRSHRLNPALLLNRYDKRKSSPAILGLPFGLKHENQLSLHLSQQRNSIEAAMLLANFNKLMSFPKPNEIEHKGGHQQWQDDMSIPSQNKNSWGQVEGSKRRYSYDVNMSWQTMPDAFLERSDLLHKPAHLSTAPPAPIAKQPDQPVATKLTWSHEEGHHPYEFARMYHPTQPLMPHGYRYHHPPPPPLHPHQQEQMPMLHPLSRQPDMAQKREEPQAYYTYTFPPQMQHHQQRYYYPVANGKLPLPPHGPMDPMQQHQQQPSYGHQMPVLIPKKRKKQKTNYYMDEEEEIEANDDEFPDMSARDVEAARTDPEARPRKQKLRFAGDQYTPQWVRYNGQSKEGLCDTCKPGKWLQLKNSAYWYHKQFFHGISSVSGKEFVQPLETRWMDQDLVEGLCHQCHQWVAVSNVKRKNSVLWYRHAHKCHVYHKPKPNAPKKR
ncbi:hypothetical protein G6F46_007396 [Rhizopus delemar]|uniref:Transcription regulator Rua1 C-terminal domain-containing protein n=2 Tax=Rhizopus TaxID=4842 RepID=A0A9P6Z2I6_9FUNG|nr:hypothetical protein G6F43_003489 [Rhizopus delemar]KAG1541985.1 hypothetical protein G6F51_007555 [Rhizopus arrhizus]KAG1458277.1 hypothetical protein G6F55_005440 [Rhizopus delemar]KAG1496949.1 hypothetical protein G6F54_006116 [Rhizopus delemar]KAG1509835.1 hypothetical protein G6F53_007142 [Rhizopus delemar]